MAHSVESDRMIPVSRGGVKCWWPLECLDHPFSSVTVTLLQCLSFYPSTCDVYFFYLFFFTLYVNLTRSVSPHFLIFFLFVLFATAGRFFKTLNLGTGFQHICAHSKWLDNTYQLLLCLQLAAFIQPSLTSKAVLFPWRHISNILNGYCDQLFAI